MAAKSGQEKAVDKSAEKVERFKKLAVKRMTRVLSGLEGVAALSNPRSYTYDNAQRDKIIAALRGAVDKVAASFNNPKAAGKSDFAL